VGVFGKMTSRWRSRVRELVKNPRRVVYENFVAGKCSPLRPRKGGGRFLVKKNIIVNTEFRDGGHAGWNGGEGCLTGKVAGKVLVKALQYRWEDQKNLKEVTTIKKG